jgi:TadE-like protein
MINSTLSQRPRFRSRRRAVAAMEFAFIAPLLFSLMLGLWQIGRIIQVKQLMDNATREGARLASQSQIIAPVGGFTQITVSSGIPNVQDTVREYLMATGVVNATTVKDVTVTFAFIDAFPAVSTLNSAPYYPYPPSAPYQPWMGVKGQRFSVTVTLPAQDINWTPYDMSGTTLTSTTTWAIMVDDPFSVNTTLPGWPAP